MSLQTPHISTPHEKRTHTINIIPFDVNNIHNVSDEADEDTIAQVHNIKTTVELPYQIYISSNSFEDAIEVSINTKGYYPSMGIILTTNTSMGHRPQLQECVKSTPAARILKWRSTLHGSFPTKIDGHKIVTLQDVDEAVRKARKATKISIVYKIFIIDKITMHP